MQSHKQTHTHMQSFLLSFDATCPAPGHQNKTKGGGGAFVFSEVRRIPAMMEEQKDTEVVCYFRMLEIGIDV